MELKLSPKLNPRGYIGRIPYFEFEVRLAYGPREIGNALETTWRELYSYAWAIAIHNGAIRLYQATDIHGAPVPVDASPQKWTERAIVVLSHPIEEIRHITLAFDQTASPMIAYERDAWVWLWRWDNAAREYVFYSSFPGADPLLVCDASVMRWVQDSDVLLLHLSQSRTQVLMRAQRENFAAARTIYSDNRSLFLDQIIATPYRLIAVGGYEENPLAVAFWLETNRYPIHLSDGVGAGASPLEGEYYIPLILHISKEALQASAGSLRGEYYIPAIYYYTPDSYAAIISSDGDTLISSDGSLLTARLFGDILAAEAAPSLAEYYILSINKDASEVLQTEATPRSGEYYLPAIAYETLDSYQLMTVDGTSDVALVAFDGARDNPLMARLPSDATLATATPLWGQYYVPFIAHTREDILQTAAVPQNGEYYIPTITYATSLERSASIVVYDGANELSLVAYDGVNDIPLTAYFVGDIVEAKAVPLGGEYYVLFVPVIAKDALQTEVASISGEYYVPAIIHDRGDAVVPLVAFDGNADSVLVAFDGTNQIPIVAYSMPSILQATATSLALEYDIPVIHHAQRDAIQTEATPLNSEYYIPTITYATSLERSASIVVYDGTNELSLVAYDGVNNTPLTAYFVGDIVEAKAVPLGGEYYV